jgi:hypothetical protein
LTAKENGVAPESMKQVKAALRNQRTTGVTAFKAISNLIIPDETPTSHIVKNG